MLIPTTKYIKIAVIHSSIPEYPLISSPYPLQSILNTTVHAAIFLRNRLFEFLKGKWIYKG